MVVPEKVVSPGIVKVAVEKTPLSTEVWGPRVMGGNVVLCVGEGDAPVPDGNVPD